MSKSATTHNDDKAVLSFEAPVLLENNQKNKIKGVLFKIGKVSGNKIAVIGFEPEAKAELLNSQKPFNIEHNQLVAGKVDDISFDESTETYQFNARIASKVAKMITNGQIKGSSWEGYAKKHDGSWVNNNDLETATPENPLFVRVASLPRIGLVFEPAHEEAKVLLANSLKRYNDSDGDDDEDIEDKTPAEPVRSFYDLSGGTPTPQEIKNAMNRQHNITGGTFANKQAEAKAERKAFILNKKNNATEQVAGLIKNALTSATAGITLKQTMPMFADYVQGGNFLSEFCNFDTGMNDRKITSISTNQLLAEQVLNENAPGTTGDNTYNDGTLSPRSRISFIHDISNTELKLGALTEQGLAMLMMKNFMRKATKIALTGNNAVSPIIRGIGNDAGITPTTGNATWIINDFNKVRKNKPYTANGRFLHVIGFSDFMKLQDYLITLGNGFTAPDLDFLWTDAYNHENDFAIVGNAVSNPVCVLNDDVIVPAANLQTRYYGNFKALGVQFLGMPELIVDPYTKASTNTSVFTLTVEMDARVANVNQLGYMTGVNVA